MRVHTRTLATSCFLLAAAIGGCAAPAAEGDDEGATSADALSMEAVRECVAEAPTTDESKTDARARCLTRYASRALERFAGGNAAARAIPIRVEAGSCFTETPSSGPWLGNYDLRSESDVRELVQQVEFTAEFLARLVADADGYPIRWFKGVALCPAQVVGGNLVLEGDTLYVGMRAGVTSFARQNAFELRAGWTQGKHLEKNLKFLTRAWPVLDPVGSPRIVLRRAVADAATALRQRLAEARGQPENVARAALLEAVRDHVSSLYKGEADAPLAERARARIAELPADKLEALAAAWSSFVDDRANADGMTEAVLAAHEATARKAYDIDVVQAGLVAVGNFHDIAVSVSGFLSAGNARFARYVTLEKVTNTVRVRQYALVAVYTIDNVEVNVSVGAERGLETAGLEHALARL